MGRRRSKSPSNTELSVSWASASARLTAVKVLPSAGDGLVTMAVCSGCSVCRWFKRVRSVRNSSAGVSCELLRSSRCDSGAGLELHHLHLRQHAGMNIQPHGGAAPSLTGRNSSGASGVPVAGGWSIGLPPISARRKASCTRLIFSPMTRTRRSSKPHCGDARSGNTSRRSSKSFRQSAALDQASQASRRLRRTRGRFPAAECCSEPAGWCKPDVLQILQRSILDFLGAGQRHPQHQPDHRADANHAPRIGEVGLSGVWAVPAFPKSRRPGVLPSLLRPGGFFFRAQPVYSSLAICRSC
jgi:hypothetical protein